MVNLWHYICARGQREYPQEKDMIKKIILYIPLVMYASFAFAATPNKPTSTGAQSATAPRVLIAYFSMLDGNTGDVARAIADASGGDMYRIRVAQPYPQDDKARKELLTQQVEQNIFPALSGPTPQISEYDIIFLGSPVWANHLSQPVKSFLHNNNLSGKTVIPFASHSGGGRGRVFSDVADMCTGCIVDTDGWSSWGGGRQRGIAKWVDKKLKRHK